MKGFSRDKVHASDADDRDIARIEISELFCKQSLWKRSFSGLLSGQKCAMLIVLPRPQAKRFLPQETGRVMQVVIATWRQTENGCSLRPLIIVNTRGYDGSRMA